MSFFFSGTGNIPERAREVNDRLFRQKSDYEGDSSTLLSLDDEEDSREAEVYYYCIACRNRITSARQIIEVKGSHTHYYANPFGYVFGIGCFAGAPGVINKGTPTLENTWFAGYSWTYSFCGRCFKHLGWQYLSRFNSGSFYGLILDHLIRE
ncbi:MAG: cereblon family protein [Thermodesulfobacteriota bacterium]